jgi:hypothetical protein
MLKKDTVKIITTDQDIDDEIELGNEICDLTVGVNDFYTGLCNHCRAVGVPIINMVECEFQEVVDFIHNEANKRADKTVSFTIQTNKK